MQAPPSAHIVNLAGHLRFVRPVQHFFDWIIVRTLLINPPFGSIHWPSHGIHVLQSVARTRGLQVDVLYANLMFAGLLGEDVYEAICDYPFMEFLGERVMAWFIADPSRTALPPEAQADLDAFNHSRPQRPSLSAELLLQTIALWRSQVLARVMASDGQPQYEIIGFTTTFDQTNACRILLRACREALPQAIYVIGGANCDAAMAAGIADYIPEVDHIFSGESELTFASFLSEPPAFAGQKILRSQRNEAVNDLPLNNYAQFTAQFAEFLPHSANRDQVELSYESSRGCWWGNKHHCTFCGLNRDGIGFREKAAGKVFADLMHLHKEQGAKRILMSDYIMPAGFYKTLLPQLAKAQTGLQIFYEIKANIDLPKAMLLKQAGVQRIQPGIEALHTQSLKLMKKGVSARQNIALLRYARALNIHVLWNLLYGFPGEQEAWFAEVLHLLPLLEHLQPPSGIYQINIDRFSPYFTAAAEYGFVNLRPHPSYQAIFPDHADLSQIAYHFCADLTTPTLASSPILPQLQSTIDHWLARWQARGGYPSLIVMELKQDQYLLIDSRSFHPQPHMQQLTLAQAQACLVEPAQRDATTEWALEQRLAIEYDGHVLPLAVADPQILLRFEQANRKTDAGDDAAPALPSAAAGKTIRLQSVA